jgi:uncharacterized protein DUF4157
MHRILLILLLIAFAINCYSQENNRPQKIRVIGNSLLAKAAAKINRQETFAITFGRTIFVSCKKEDFFKKEWWVRHELTHVAQYQKHGVLQFLSLYIYYSVFHHKSENPFEKEAEDAEFSSD